MQEARILLTALATICATLPALSAAPASATILEPEESARLLASFDAFGQKHQRFQEIGRKLTIGNAPYCDNAPLSIGLTLVDLRGFSRPIDIRTALRWGGELGVATITPPYDYQGRGGLHGYIPPPPPLPNDEIIAIDGARINSWPADEKLDWKRLKRVHDAIDASLAANGKVRLTLRGETSLVAKGVPACATRFELLGKGKKALADGMRVQFGSQFPGFDYPKDEFAAVIAHELAHNLLRHREWLDAKGRKRRNVRATEREADRLMPWLIANAGYDPMAAVRFMERWGPKHSKGIFRARTHDGWDERAEFIAKEARLVQAKLDNTGTADWSQHFRREIEPLVKENSQTD